MILSRKRFNQSAKRLKRKQFITADAARNYMARQHGYPDFATMEKTMVEKGDWK